MAYHQTASSNLRRSTNNRSDKIYSVNLQRRVTCPQEKSPVQITFTSTNHLIVFTSIITLSSNHSVHISPSYANHSTLSALVLFSLDPFTHLIFLKLLYPLNTRMPHLLCPKIGQGQSTKGNQLEKGTFKILRVDEDSFQCTYLAGFDRRILDIFSPPYWKLSKIAHQEVFSKSTVKDSSSGGRTDGLMYPPL